MTTLRNIFINVLEVMSVLIVAIPLLLVKINLSTFKFWAESLSIFPGEIGIFLRRAYYTFTLKSCGKRLRVDFGGIIQYPNIKIGNNVSIGKYTVVSKCDIGNDVRMGGHIYLLSGKNTHNIDDTSKPIWLQGGKRERIKIGNDVWIGANSTVMTNVSQGTVIGANSLVNKTFEEYSVLAGSPAKVLRVRGK